MATYGVTNTFASQSGNVAVSQLDQDFTDVLLGINNAYLVGTLAARPAVDGIGKGRYYYATDVQIMYRDNGTSWVQVSASTLITAPRGAIGGLTLSMAGGSTTISIAAGQATDSTAATMMSIGAFTKTTASFAAGSGNGALDTGASGGSASTWYHLWLISTANGALTDILMSLSATAPTMPATYTLKRRIGSALLDGAKNWTLYTQVGDEFLWSVAVLDANGVAYSVAAATLPLTVPTGIQVWARCRFANNGGTGNGLYFSSLDESDQAPSLTVAPLMSEGGGGSIRYGGALPDIRTNTSAQIRHRAIAAGVSTFFLATYGWVDRRGRDL